MYGSKKHYHVECEIICTTKGVSAAAILYNLLENPEALAQCRRQQRDRIVAGSGVMVAFPVSLGRGWFLCLYCRKDHGNLAGLSVTASLLASASWNHCQSWLSWHHCWNQVVITSVWITALLVALASLLAPVS